MHRLMMASERQAEIHSKLLPWTNLLLRLLFQPSETWRQEAWLRSVVT